MSEIQFYHQPNDKEETVGDLIIKLAKNADKISIATAFLSEGGINTVKNYFSHKPTQIVCGINGYISDVDKLNQHDSNYKTFEGRIYAGDEPMFHPKLYMFEHGKFATILLGSANFTGGGLIENNEIVVQFKIRKNDTTFEKINDYFNLVWDSSMPVSEFVKECPDYNKSKKGKKDKFRLDASIKDILHNYIKNKTELVFNDPITPSFHTLNGQKTIDSGLFEILNTHYLDKGNLSDKMMIILEDGSNDIESKIIHIPSSGVYQIDIIKGVLSDYSDLYDADDYVEWRINLDKHTIHLVKTKKD